jgi:RNA polymerase sigma-70 factor (ECF subfamily)
VRRPVRIDPSGLQARHGCHRLGGDAKGLLVRAGVDRTDEALLAASATGDERAFELFYRRWLGPVTAFHLRRTRRNDVALDLTAETFAALVVSLDRFDPSQGSAAGWLFGIASHKLSDSLRRGRVQDEARRALGHEPVAIDDRDLLRVEELAAGADDAQRLRSLLAELPIDQAQAVIARVIDERAYSELAQQMDCSEALVRQRVHRGLTHMRARLQEER